MEMEAFQQEIRKIFHGLATELKQQVRHEQILSPHNFH
jgi:hypothetical protein